MEVNFDAGTLECMLDFIYTGRYSDTPFQPTQLAQPTSTSAGNQPGMFLLITQQATKSPRRNLVRCLFFSLLNIDTTRSCHATRF